MYGVIVNVNESFRATSADSGDTVPLPPSVTEAVMVNVSGSGSGSGFIFLLQQPQIPDLL